MKLDMKPYKGTRDFYPEDKRVQNHIFQTWREVSERFGYEEYDAPLLEPLDIYKAKTGEEIVSEQLYRFKDRGGREVAIRPEMTPSVSRMVAARRQELSYPLRWFSVGRLWRYERPQRGRLREHWQLNVDIFGEKGISAEHEVIQLADAIMEQFGAKRGQYEIRLNSRALTDHICREYLKLSNQQSHDLVKLLDKTHKIDPAALEKGAKEIVGSDTKHEKLSRVINSKNLKELPDDISQHSSVRELEELLNTLKKSGITNSFYDPTLMRGFDYYTDIVFEIFDSNPDNNRSMFGGGRYDGLVGLFGVEPVPTVGFGMGDVTLKNFLESNKLLPDLRSSLDLEILLVGDIYAEANQIAAKLRSKGLNVAVDASQRKLDKKLKSADKRGQRYVLIIGQKELDQDKYKLKDLAGGKESEHSADQIVETLKGYRGE